jgi:uncharacterized protein (TIGR02246 family)
MTEKPVRSLFVLLALSLAACTPRADGPTDSSRSNIESGGDIELVRSAVDARLKLYIDALLKGDAVGAASIYTDDAVRSVSDLEPIRGRPAIEKHHADWLASTTFSEAIGSTEELIPTGDTLAVEFGTYEWTFTPKGRRESRERGRYMNLWRRDETGAWKISREILSAVTRN